MTNVQGSMSKECSMTQWPETARKASATCRTPIGPRVLVVPCSLVIGTWSFAYGNAFVLFEAVPDERVELLAQGVVLDAVDDLAGEGMDQHTPRCLQANAPAAQVINRLVVQLADGCAVRAFHVVGVDLELRLGVGAGFVGEEEVFVRLLGIGFL